MIAPLHIDGSQGEGGGQIVRSSLALALVTGRGVTIENIRARRDRPGLMRQHLVAVQAAAAISGAQVAGAEIGSRLLQFEPQLVQAGAYQFDIGSAGSATLVLQTVLPALLIADAPSTLRLRGGTHNPWAPPFDFLERAYLPLVRRMGPRVTATLQRHGFYPAGGGEFAVAIEPCRELAGFDLLERGPIVSHTVRALVANLPLHIAEREIGTVLWEMEWGPECGRVQAVDAHGQGNVVSLELVSQHVTEVFTAFGRKHVWAEEVAREGVREAQAYLQTDAPVGPYLADQFMLPLGISAWQPPASGRPRGGSFRTLPLTGHSATHLAILRQFLQIDIGTEMSADGQTCLIGLHPAAIA